MEIFSKSKEIVKFFGKEMAFEAKYLVHVYRYRYERIFSE